MIPVVYFSIYDITRMFEGKELKTIHQETETIRKQMKKAIGYEFDNSHFYIIDVHGYPALSISFYEEDIWCWNAKTGAHIGSMHSLDTEKIREWTQGVSKNLHFCQEGD